VEIVKRAIAAYNLGDIDAYADLTTADFELLPALERTVDAVSYRGREGIETHLGNIRDTWQELHVLADEIFVIRRPRARARPGRGTWKGSGVQVDEPAGRETTARSIRSGG
jgi:hypothetical protein